MFEHYFAVIMAGGGGTRLWPLSRQTQPKQMLRLFGDDTLFQTAVKRLEGLFSPDHILVVTVSDQAKDLRQQCPQIPEENFLIEPMPRGTASVVGMAAVALEHRDPQAVMAILTSDHYIGNVENFLCILKSAYQVARDNYLVTLGIAPVYPATGYGYIQRGELIKAYNGDEVYRVARFKEKPDENQAKAMLAGGDHSWNSGMFVWKVARILEEFARQMPGLKARLDDISHAWNTPQKAVKVNDVWSTLKSETIDYGIMEGARQVAVIPAIDLQWSDVGSWDSLFEVLPADPNGNIVTGGNHIGVDTQKSLVFQSGEGRLIVTIGVSDLVIVDTGDVLLVCSKDQAQKVRQVVDYLKKNDPKYI
jgi:mannose-1-phosphate guanylyltransferase